MEYARGNEIPFKNKRGYFYVQDLGRIGEGRRAKPHLDSKNQIIPVGYRVRVMVEASKMDGEWIDLFGQINESPSGPVFTVTCDIEIHGVLPQAELPKVFGPSKFATGPWESALKFVGAIGEHSVVSGLQYVGYQEKAVQKKLKNKVKTDKVGCPQTSHCR